MARKTKMLWLHALTPLHVGSGRGVGFIDLPIMREKVTKWPLVPGSAIKGVLADHFKATEDRRTKDTKEGRLLRAAFGLAGDEISNSGSLVITDARLVCLPIRSLFGTFAWVASPFALRRLTRDLSSANCQGIPGLPDSVSGEELLCPEGTASACVNNGKVYLEDLDFSATENRATALWAERLAAWVFADDPGWQLEFKKRFVIVSDDTFDFLGETGTEVAARIRIDPKKKSVMTGALWYEESLPAETILASLIWCDRVFPKDAASPEELMEKYCSEKLQLQVGGSATVGRGQVQCTFIGDGGKNVNA